MLYFTLPHRFRWAFLLAASYYFYACWKVEYLLLIMFSTLVDYWAGLKMGEKESREKRRPFLIGSLLVNLGMLFFFKYLTFFNESFRAFFQTFNIFYGVPAFDILLPVGISFYTFQTLSYAIDVYYGKKIPERHLGIFALYVSFFPQLVAGPVERSQRLLPQFHEKKSLDPGRVADGLKRMAWGFFKKLVIADRLAVYVDAVYNQPDAYGGWPVIIATYFFMVQLYCDFSAYSDIAIGAAKVMGYDLMENFRRPFFAKSVQEFWDRWHISMTSWFRDYLFFSLAWRKSISKVRWLSSIMLTFILIGFWHGANFTFLMVGFLHGAYLVTSSLTTSWRKKSWQALRVFVEKTEQRFKKMLPMVRIFDISRQGLAMFIAFNLVIFSVVFFRANQLSDAWLLLGNMVDFNRANPLIPNWNDFELFIALIAMSFMFGIQILEEMKNTDWLSLLKRQPLLFRHSLYILTIVAIVLFAQADSPQFVYFQF